MAKVPIEDLKLEKQSSANHSSKTFKLLWILDITDKTPRKSYRVLFKDINSGMYLTEEIPPEFLSYYTMGSHYRDSELLSEPAPEGDTYLIKVTSTDGNRIVPVSKVLTDAEYPLTHSFTSKASHNTSKAKEFSKDFTSEIKRQYCLEFSHGTMSEPSNPSCQTGTVKAANVQPASFITVTVIIPCAVIGEAYYFLSSSMREAIFSSKLESLYVPGTIKKDPITKLTEIEMKSGAADDDAAHIIRFATDTYAKQRWSAIKNNLLTEKAKTVTSGQSGWHVPLKIDLPVVQDLILLVRGVRIRNTAGGQDKLLVYDILGEDSAFDFDIYRVIRRTNAGIQSSGPISIPKMPRIVRKNTRRLKSIRPSSKNLFVDIIHRLEEKNYNIRDMMALKELKPRQTQALAAPFFVPSDQQADISLEQSSSSGDPLVAPGRFQRVPKGQPVNSDSPFTLEDFRKMVGRLKHDSPVSSTSYTVHAPQDMPRKTKRRGDMLTLRESYNGRHGNRRQYQRISFDYRKADDSVISVCVVEIDQRRLQNGSSIFILADAGGRAVPGSAVTELLTGYVDAETLEQIGNRMGRQGLTFMHKKHPMEKGKEFLRRWCEALKERLERV